MLKTIPRHQLDPNAWDACVANSRQSSVYGYAWYLDAVLPAPDWKWVGIIRCDETGDYTAVMPVPLRRKTVAGISYEWVVHQPLFCQFLAVFSRDTLLDTAPFYQQMVSRFRYGALYCTRQFPDIQSLHVACQKRTTHTIDLSASYETIYAAYTPDRKQNLRKAHHDVVLNDHWALIDSTDVEPLLTLFRNHHADTIDGGVADWAYAIIKSLTLELHQRGLLRIRYARRDGQTEAGALFVMADNRITYLFNAASTAGRKANVRTLLIDQLLQERAEEPLVFDFESPLKPSIRHFYQRFGAVEEPFYELRWNRLSPIENLVRAGKRYWRRSG